MTEQQTIFIVTVGEIARDNMKQTGILASLTVAQAILESGWGTSGLAVKGKALFGIKTTNWKGKTYNSNTQECYNGTDMVTINANFRSYDSWEESIEDHVKLLTTATRYKSLIGITDYVTACRLIKECGYATDPDYPSKLVSLITKYKLYEYDTPIKGEVEEVKEVRFTTVKELPLYAQPIIQELLDLKVIADTPNLDLSIDMIRGLIFGYRMMKLSTYGTGVKNE